MHEPLITKMNRLNEEMDDKTKTAVFTMINAIDEELMRVENEI